MGADPVACAALAAGAGVKAFFVRKEKKEHGLQRWVEGPLLERERALPDRGGRRHYGRLDRSERSSACARRGWRSPACVSVLDRLAGGAEAIEAAAGAPYVALTTIDDVYPERPDR